MEQKKHQKQKQNQEQLPFSGQLRQNIINQPCDLAALWGRAADSFPQNKRKQRIRTTIAVVVGVVIGRIGDALFILARALDLIIICNFT
ncbi:MAG: hypothetical protein IKL26_03885 [Bacteroidales bacterium]|nr:hypothetical protein [Bacteroidales bacterium]